MKKVLCVGLLASCVAMEAMAVQVPPKGDEGTELPTAVQQRLGLPGGCRVALPDPSGKSARVARVASRMSVWVADQMPNGKEPPKLYLRREGDDRVYLVGPARDPVNMGATPALAIYQREANNIPIGLVDHSDEVHWMALSNLGEVVGRVKEYKDGLGDAGMIEKQSFTVNNGRIYPAKPFKKPENKKGEYKVTILLTKVLGQPRVFGVCM